MSDDETSEDQNVPEDQNASEDQNVSDNETSEDQNMSVDQNVSDDETHDLTNFNVAPTKLNQAFSIYLKHIFLAFMIFPRFLNQTSIKISNTFKNTLRQKYSQRYLINQESLDDVYGLGLHNMSHWDDSLRDAILLQNIKESSNEPFTTDDSEYINNGIADNSKCGGENIPNNLQISISS